MKVVDDVVNEGLQCRAQQLFSLSSLRGCEMLLFTPSLRATKPCFCTVIASHETVFLHRHCEPRSGAAILIKDRPLIIANKKAALWAFYFN